MRENDKQMRDKLSKVTSKKVSLEKKLQDNASLKEIQENIEILTQLLKSKNDELITIKANANEAI